MSVKRARVKTFEPRVSDTQEKMMSILSQIGPTTKYTIKKKMTRVEYPVVHNAMKSLIRQKFVKEVSRQKGATGVQTILYELTSYGVCWLIFRTSSPAVVGRLAGKYKAVMPTIFGIWPELVRAGIENLALDEVRMIAQRMAYVVRPFFPERPVPEMINTDAFFILPLVERPPETQRRWLAAVESNTALKLATTKAFGSLNDETSKILKIISK